MLALLWPCASPRRFVRAAGPPRRHAGNRPTAGTAGCSATPASALSVAPMMEYTDVHFRALARILSRNALLYTEMEVDQTLIHQASNGLDRYLWFPKAQSPVALQLGGSDAENLRRAAALAAPYGYDEVNLNSGCPSETVAGKGCFGAALMRDPAHVASLCTAMRDGLASATPPNQDVPPVTVKHRLGVDETDSYGELCDFVGTVSERGGVTRFIVHGRIALLNGISPADNRSIPPLRPGWVAALRRDFPHITFDYNGGVPSAAAVAAARASGPLAGGGFMIGRAAYHQPWSCLAPADVLVYGEASAGASSRREALELYALHCDEAERISESWDLRRGGLHPRVLLKPVLNLFHGARGNGAWKRAYDSLLRDNERRRASDVLRGMMQVVDEDVLDAAPSLGIPEDADFLSATDASLPLSRSSRAGLSAGLTLVVTGRKRRRRASVVPSPPA